MSLSIAIIGTGPSALYAADGILKKAPEARIDLIDRLPTPYGLVRFGVAPDHLGTKNVTRQFDKTFEKENVRLFGNLTVGHDITIEELKSRYDAVLLATGAQQDKTLGIEGEDLEGIYGSAAFVGWYNGHPDRFAKNPIAEHTRQAVVIGNGNVSIDISRLLIKEESELAESDICAHARKAILEAGIQNVYLAGRRGPLEASFTPPELRELGKLEKAVPVIENADIPDALPDSIDTSIPSGRVTAKNMEIMRSFADLEADKAERKIHLLFHASPVAFLGDRHVTAVRFEKTAIDDEGRAVGTGEFFEIPADLVVTAIGYRSRPIEGIPFDEKRGNFPNNDGHIEDNLYVVGWGKRGPSGTIPTNRADSFQVANKLLDDLAGQDSEKGGPDAFDSLIRDKGLSPTSFSDWKTIERAEEQNATAPAPREKFTSIQDMLALLN
ncbi:FAD-dependent oxidoreductase [Aestuariispira insulae]|uniref:Ferredoxin--NADP+ reductase n=1 Tax=Aestuariispira insulae TaxID=1461337 RepID=A0A3D9HN33_9PROT|nr:FAD-dependent oxidoreductase [Aestuariispira insulae]RED50917.1 ferredoxin--NADP+ reductase [Aestuariispira insulae]